MNLFKPKRTFESVVRELVAGLEDGSIILSKEADTSQPAKRTIENLLFSGSLGMRMKANPAPSPINRHHRFVTEWVGVDLGTIKEFPLDFSPIGR